MLSKKSIEELWRLKGWGVRVGTVPVPITYGNMLSFPLSLFFKTVPVQFIYTYTKSTR
jgi:hypothetical protein